MAEPERHDGPEASSKPQLSGARAESGSATQDASDPTHDRLPSDPASPSLGANAPGATPDPAVAPSPILPPASQASAPASVPGSAPASAPASPGIASQAPAPNAPAATQAAQDLTAKSVGQAPASTTPSVPANAPAPAGASTVDGTSPTAGWRVPLSRPAANPTAGRAPETSAAPAAANSVQAVASPERRPWMRHSTPPSFPGTDHAGARDRPARRLAVRPSGIGDAPVGEIGRILYAIVQEQPGIHFRGLARAANLTSAGQLRHHLDRLERHGLLVELEDGRYKRFFVAGDHEPELRPGLARFSRMVPRRIGKLLLAGPMNRTELRRSLGCADSTLGYHLNRMLRAGDLQRQRTPTGCHYALANEGFVRRLLQQQGEARPQAQVQSGGAVTQTVPTWGGTPGAHPLGAGVRHSRPPRPPAGYGSPASPAPPAPPGSDAPSDSPRLPGADPGAPSSTPTA